MFKVIMNLALLNPYVSTLFPSSFLMESIRERHAYRQERVFKKATSEEALVSPPNKI